MTIETIRIILEHPESPNYDASAESDLINTLPWKLPQNAALYEKKPPLLKYVDTPEEVGGAGSTLELLVTFAQNGGTVAAVAAAIYSGIKLYLLRSKYREVTLERGDDKLTIKGHTMPEERELLETLFPEIADETVILSPPKLEISFTTATLKLIESNEANA